MALARSRHETKTSNSVQEKALTGNLTRTRPLTCEQLTRSLGGAAATQEHLHTQQAEHGLSAAGRQRGRSSTCGGLDGASACAIARGMVCRFGLATSPQRQKRGPVDGSSPASAPWNTMIMLWLCQPLLCAFVCCLSKSLITKVSHRHGVGLE